MKQFFKDTSTEIKILLLAFIACIVIYASFYNLISVWYIIMPIVILGVIGVLSYFLRQRFGRTFGITVFLLSIVFVLGGQYFFSKYFPVTTDTIVSQKKDKDLQQFDKFKPGMDARIQIEKLQKENDSLTSLQVLYIRQDRDTIITNKIKQQIQKNISKMDDIYSAIEVNDDLYTKNQEFLFKNSKDKNEETKSISRNDRNLNPSEVTVEFWPGKIVPTGIQMTGKEEIEVIPISGKFEIKTSAKEWLMITDHQIFPDGGSAGPLSIRGVDHGKVTIKKIVQ